MSRLAVFALGFSVACGPGIVETTPRHQPAGLNGDPSGVPPGDDSDPLDDGSLPGDDQAGDPAAAGDPATGDPATGDPPAGDPGVSFGLTPIHLRSTNGDFLAARDNGGAAVAADHTAPGPAATFTLLAPGAATLLDGGLLASGTGVYLRTANGSNYLVADGGGGGAVAATSASPGAYEKFVLVALDGGDLEDGSEIALRAANGQYVVAESGGGGPVNANRDAIGPWETFHIFVQGTALLDPGEEAGGCEDPFVATYCAGAREPPNEMALVQALAEEYSTEFYSCDRHQDDFLQILVPELRRRDPRWGFNWVRGVHGDSNGDVVGYYYGPGEPQEDSPYTTIVDVVVACGSEGDGEGVNWLVYTESDQATCCNPPGGEAWTLEPLD